eukprot:363308-Chlamydomonas_euryale.AAC.7
MRAVESGWQQDSFLLWTAASRCMQADGAMLCVAWMTALLSDLVVFRVCLIIRGALRWHAAESRRGRPCLALFVLNCLQEVGLLERPLLDSDSSSASRRWHV